MSSATPPALDPARLEEAARAAEPSARLLPPRLLRRIAAQLAGHAGPGRHAPHAFAVHIDKAALLALAERDGFDLDGTDDLPEAVLLLPRPAARDLAGRPPEHALRDVWRLLFHAAVDRAIDDRKYDRAAVIERVRKVGPAVFREARQVLRAEHVLPAAADEVTAYREFAATFLELRHFAPKLLGSFFPGVADPRAVEAVLTADVPAEQLLSATKPVGASDLEDWAAPEEPLFEDEAEAAPSAETAVSVADTAEQAQLAAQKGNLVRAAILQTRLGRAGDGAAADAAGRSLDRLVGRLRAALRLSEATAAEWRAALEPLLVPASAGVWPWSARLLYDLQKVCVDTERPQYAIGVARWVLSLGRRPLRRRLPLVRSVQVLRHLRGAYRRLGRVPVTEHERHRLVLLMRVELHRAERTLRSELRPGLVRVLRDAGLRPTGLAEQVAHDKLVEELLDRACERGLVTIGDLRDAVARNQLKLPDLAGPVEWLTGDMLLRADRMLAEVWDGVYRRGEVYMRALQRGSSLFFGTRPGRFVTRYFALPFVGAYIGLEGLSHVPGYVVGAVNFLLGVKKPETHGHEHHFTLVTWWSVLLVGLAVIALTEFPRFCRHAWAVTKRVFRGVWHVVGDLPGFALRLPGVRWLWDSVPAQFVRRYVVVPALIAGGVVLFLDQTRFDDNHLGLAAAVTFAAGMVLCNTRPGRELQRLLGEAAAETWDEIRRNLIPGILQGTVELFKRGVERVERLLYAVDEALRFRAGESRLLLPVKAALGMLWAGVAYVTRFAVNLLIEPQINPIKHFPVVTVSHKLLLPFVISTAPKTVPSTFGAVLAAWLGWSVEKANYWAFLIVAGIPGIFGFLVWELMNNWRLYRSNRAGSLNPVRVGHHGETMRGLLVPGFHSGTVPKTYARLRAAERAALTTGNNRPVRKHRLALEHLQEEIRHFVERELVAVLRGSERWDKMPVHVGRVSLDTHRVRVALAVGGWDDDPASELWLAFEEHSGWVIASVAHPGWLDRLTQPQRKALADALAGLYKLAAVDFVQEQADREFPAGWSVDGSRLSARESAYDLEAVADVLPPVEGVGGPVDATKVVLSRVPLPWPAWAEQWKRDPSAKNPPGPLVPGWRFLP